MSSLWLVLVTAGLALAHPTSNCVCLPFTQCDENGQILEYGDLITIDVRLGGSCGDGEVCCSLPPDDSWSKEKDQDQDQPQHQTYMEIPFLALSNYNYNYPQMSIPVHIDNLWKTTTTPKAHFPHRGTLLSTQHNSYKPNTSTEKTGHPYDQAHDIPDKVDLPKEKHDKPGNYFSKHPYDAVNNPTESWGETTPEQYETHHPPGHMQEYEEGEGHGTWDDTVPQPHEAHHSHQHQHCKNDMDDGGVLSAILPKGLHGCGLRRHTPLDARFHTIPFLNREYTLYGEYPWTVAIWKQGTEQFLCGGSLIKPGVVLTAAHCVFIQGEKGDLMVTAGDWDIECDSEPVPRQERAVRKIVVHEEYQNRTLLNDIALLLLDEPMELSEAVDVICLSHTTSHKNNECLATGWSTGKSTDEKSSVMTMVKLPMVKRDTCLKKLRTTRLGHYFKLHKSFMCAGGEENVDTCKGDGGGPLICQNMDDPEGRFVQVGIVSWGIDCGTDVPAVYTSVSYFYPWIQRHLHL